MKRILAILLILLILFPVYSVSSSTSPVKYEYVPYEAGEFPQWSVELRRAESIFFGSFVIALPLSVGVYNIAKSLGMPSTNATAEALYQIAGAAGIASVIALADWIIGEMQK